MTFLAPYLLWGTLAAGIPIALHFFYRSHYRVVPWAAMKFLLLSIEQTSRRLRFQELLLLALRVALLVLLALALARPTSTAARGSGQGDAVDAVLVVDNSFSMAARDGDATRLERARAAALEVVEQLPPHSTVQVITAAGGRATLVGPSEPGQRDQARQLLAELDYCHLASDLSPAVALAEEVLHQGAAPNKELYLFSDMQKLAWEQQAEPLTAGLRRIGERAAVTLIRCGSRPPRNVTLVGIAPPSVPRAGERADFAVLVRNTGKETARDLTLTLAVDGHLQERDTKPLAELAAGETRAVVLTAKLDQPGRRVVTATVQPDDLDADNRFDLVVQVRDQVGILVVDGRPDDLEPRASGSFYLVNALYPVPAQVVGPAQASSKHLVNKDLCILVNVALEPNRNDRAEPLDAEFLHGLARFVREGNGLVIFGGDRVNPEAYNRLLVARHRLLPVSLTGVHAAPEYKPLQFDRQSADVPPFLKFRQADEYKILDLVEIRNILTLAPVEHSAVGEVPVLLRYRDGRPAVIGRKRPGEGDVLLFTTSASADPWTDWPLHPSFVPLVQASLSHLLQGPIQAHNRVAGEPLRWYPTDRETGASFTAFGPANRRNRLGRAVALEGRAVVETAETAHAGIYRIAAEEGEAIPFAVTPDLRESEDLDSLTEDQMKERLGFPVTLWVAGTDGTASGDRLHREWTLWLLLGVLALVLGEAALAWLCGRAW